MLTCQWGLEDTILESHSDGERSSLLSQNWHWVLERAVLHMKIFFQHWHISEEGKVVLRGWVVVLRVHKVVIEILHMAKSGRFPRSCLLLENSPSPNSAYLTKMEIPARTRAAVDQSHADKVLLAIMADKMANQTTVTMTMWKHREQSRKCRGWCKLLGNQRVKCSSPHNWHKNQVQDIGECQEWRQFKAHTNTRTSRKVPNWKTITRLEWIMFYEAKLFLLFKYWCV